MRRKLQDRILTRGRQSVARKRLMPYEPAASVTILLLLVLIGAWVIRQRDRFDPKLRGIGIDFSRKARIELAVGGAAAGKIAPPGSPAGASLGFPAAVVPQGWQVKRAKRFDTETLYEKVDGQAEQYLKFQFKELRFVAMTRGEASIDLYLYDQGSAKNALGLFAEMRVPGETVGEDGAMHYLQTEAGSYGILGRFFFQVIGSDTDADSLDAVRRGLIDLPLEEEEKPIPILRFEAMGVPFDRISYEPVDSFQLDFVRHVWFAALDAEGTERLFLHQAASPTEAATLLRQMVEALGGEYEKAGEPDGAVLLKHRFLKTFFLVEAQGPMVVGVEGAKEAREASTALAPLAEGLHDE